MELVSLPISILSLAIALGTFWLAFVDRGRLKMTKPTIVFFGFDTIPRPTPKVFLRTLLYSTSNRGHVIESMILRVRRARIDRRQLHGVGLIVCDEQGQGSSGEISAGRFVEIARHDHRVRSDTDFTADRRGPRDATARDPIGEFGKAGLGKVHT